MPSLIYRRFLISIFCCFFILIGGEANARIDTPQSSYVKKADKFPTAVFEILQRKIHGLATADEKETEVTTILDRIVTNISKSKQISVVYGENSDSNSSECSGMIKPYLCVIHIDSNMDGQIDDVSRMIEVTFPEDKHFFNACPECSLALPWQIAVFTQGDMLYITTLVPHALVRTYYRSLSKSDPTSYNGLMKLASKYKARIEKAVAATFVSGLDGFETVNQPWADANGKVFNLGEKEISFMEGQFGGPLTTSIMNSDSITPNVMMYEWVIPNTTVDIVTTALKNGFIANTVADLNQDGVAGNEADKMVLPQNVMGFITADSPTFEEIGSMLGMAATDIWPNGYTLQQWKVVRSMNFSRVAGRELSMIELCQDFYAGMVLGFGPHHQPALPCGLLIWKAEDGKIHVGLHNPQFLLGLFFSDVQLGDDPVSQRSGQLFQSFPTIVFNELRGVVEHTLANFMTGPVSEFESARAVVDGWLSSNTGKTIASSQVKTDIVDQWDTAQEMYQIVSLEKAKQYRTGHVPHAINISFRTLLDNLATLDPSREIITYDATGNIGQISSTILSLMGFPSRNMKFGMMDWNLKDMRRDIGKKQWDGVANYELETQVNTPNTTYDLPELFTGMSQGREILSSQAANYLTYTLNLKELKPTISSMQVKEIIDDWDSNQNQYQILSVRSAEHYQNGHVPHAINIPLGELGKAENLAQLDPNKITIVYCYTGHTGQVATTLLNLLGYKARNMMFGMMDWNLERSTNDGVTPWDLAADYPVRKGKK